MKKIFLILLFVFFTSQLYSQWIGLNPIPDPIPGQNYTSVHFIDSQNGWISGNRGVIIRTTDGGNNWFHQETGINSILWKIRFADLLNGWAVGDSGKIINTTNGGNTWILQSSTNSMQLTMLSVINNQDVWAAGRWGSSQQDILLHTTNSGGSWSTISPRLDGTNEHLSALVFINQNNGWYCTWQYVSPFTGGAIYHTSDGGQSWVRQFAGSHLLSSIFISDDNYGWCVGDWSLYVTTNGGGSWAERGNLSSRYFSDVHFVDHNIGWLIEHVNNMGGFQSSAINFTSDGGQNWINQFTTGTYYKLYDFAVIDKRIGWAAVANSTGAEGYMLNTTNGGGVFPSIPILLHPINNQLVNTDSINFGWKSATPGVTNYLISISTDSLFNNFIDTLIVDTTLALTNLEIDTKYFWRVKALNGLGYGGFSNIGSFVTNVTDVKDEIENKFDFYLGQNYPNPFNPSTVISYQLPIAGNVTLKVFDVLGNEVATLVDEYRNAGSYDVEFNPVSSIRHPASGIYFYQLKSGDFVQTKKMMLIK